MVKIARVLLLVAGMTGLVLAVGRVPMAPAQEKKEKEEEKEKEASGKAYKAGTAEVYKDKAGEYQFRIKGADGKVLAVSPKGYATREACHDALGVIRATLNAGPVTDIKDDDK